MPTPIPRDHALAGVWAKIDRAAWHVLDLEEAKQRYLKTNPISFINIEDPKTRYHHVIVTSIKPPPLQLSVLIGDALHNLRSALDLLAWQLVKLRIGEDEFAHVYFPIGSSLQAYRDGLSRNRIRLAGEDTIRIIDEWEPYQDGKHNDLWRLHQLNIRDKHRLLVVAPASLDMWPAESDFTPDSPGSGSEHRFDSGDHVPFPNLFVPKVGDRVISFNPDTLSMGEGRMLHVHLKMKGELAFNEPTVQSRSAVNALIAFTNTVIDTIRLFNPLFPPYRET